ncbi:hypothetical protein BT96DRAFT_820106 [Gymnopus androsaceus JB14]|uniref:T6SS Phospholipase effector Tle1-like catalytic domain-containing protein n=1 Tax=Gymnopus androsaceus JB14 TaxID=1447944 RepID=A0A6A4HS94_9AGAR|nr:hypothetical protein BT96DRAFT_820106 [Gymnopus androsaceus JB14]
MGSPAREFSQDSQGTPGSPGVVPPTHPYRTLVLGTCKPLDSGNSNIVQLFSTLKKDDRDQQLVYYQAGIGTYTSPQIATPLASRMLTIRYDGQTIDMAIGWYLHAHVMGGYEFLMQNYKATDRICIFGFSRGAYTARSLAGMIHKVVGILPAYNFQQVPFAYKMFIRDDEIGFAQSAQFKKTFSVEATIEFVGVWDTVNSVGLFPHRLPFTASNTLIKTFRHAVSLDERRAKFKANLWNPHPDDKKAGISSNDRKHSKHHTHDRDAPENRYWKDPGAMTDVEEVWFAGCHCDVGGGSVSNEETTSLARIPLRWMIRECFRCNTGILFNSDGLRSLGLDPDTLWPEVRPRTPAIQRPSAVIRPTQRSSTRSLENGAGNPNVFQTEEELDLEDSLSPIYDQLSLVLPWWIVEFLPVKNKFHNGRGEFLPEIGLNLGRARKIPRMKEGVKIHRSVKTRMEAQYENGEKYVPKAKFDLKYVTWVD